MLLQPGHQVRLGSRHVETERAQQFLELRYRLGAKVIVDFFRQGRLGLAVGAGCRRGRCRGRVVITEPGNELVFASRRDESEIAQNLQELHHRFRVERVRVERVGRLADNNYRDELRKIYIDEQSDVRYDVVLYIYMR